MRSSLLNIKILLEVRNQEGGKYIFMGLIFDPLISVRMVTLIVYIQI